MEIHGMYNGQSLPIQNTKPNCPVVAGRFVGTLGNAMSSEPPSLNFTSMTVKEQGDALHYLWAKGVITFDELTQLFGSNCVDPSYNPHTDTEKRNYFKMYAEELPLWSDPDFIEENLNEVNQRNLDHFYARKSGIEKILKFVEENGTGNSGGFSFSVQIPCIQEPFILDELYPTGRTQSEMKDDRASAGGQESLKNAE